jgi:hypothetical protein
MKETVAKIMMKREACEERLVHGVCRLGRARREQDEGRGDKGGGVARTKEARKWDEGPSGQVKGNGDPHCRNHGAYRLLKT